MKCPYKHCKLGGEVDKEDAIKYKNRYYHKECYNKKIKKGEARDLLHENFTFNGKNINISIMQLVDEKGHDVEKVLYAIKHVINNKKELNSPYGISYYLENYEVNKQYKEYLKSLKLNEIKEDVTEIKVVEETKIKHTNNRRRPKWIEII